MTTTIARLKTIQVANAYLVRQELRYYSGAVNRFIAYGGAATVRFCTAAVNPSTGVVTYTTISGMGPFSLISGGAGVFYRTIGTATINILNAADYLNETIYQVTEGGAAAELFDVVPLLVQSTRYAT